ncbi:MAG: hypothetical protein ACYC96_10905 [Fimbriimonadaceae bacterium]
MRSASVKVLPLPAKALILQAKLDSRRKWVRHVGREVTGYAALNQVVDLANSAFADHDDEESRRLFGQYLHDTAEYMSTWSVQDRRLAYYALPRSKAALGKLLLRYGVRNISEQAADVQLTESDVVALLSASDSFVEHLGDLTDGRVKTLQGRARKLALALRIFSMSLPYIEELCKMICG